MRNLLYAITLALFALQSCSQSGARPKEFNFGFEQEENEAPAKWTNFGSQNYLISLDTANVKEGKYSASIEHIDGKEADFKALAFTFPEKYEGKKITLSGYIKTRDVADGYAGLWMRIDPEVAFDNMADRGITGTTEWTRYEVTLPMDPAGTQQIVVGGLLVGKGKMWLDDLSVTIDGEDISKARPYVKELLPAEKDTGFYNGSNISFFALDKKPIGDLDLLGKIWGFLKYHHPEVGKGNYNWDYELFRILPAYLNAGDTEERDKVLLDWIGKYGSVQAGEVSLPTRENVFLEPDHEWIDDSDMSADLKAALRNIYSSRHQGKHFYVGMHAGIHNPEFKNESRYSNMPYPDAGFRLLSLYRYWNMIQYFFPGKYLTDKDWNDVLGEYIPLFISAKDELEYEIAALRIIGEIHDTHANLWSGGNRIDNLRGDYFAPLRVQFIENKLVVTDHYNPELLSDGEFAIGDIITHIDGKEVDAIVDSLRIYYPASNEPARLRDISPDMLRSNKSTIDVRYISSEEEKGTELTLYKKGQLNTYGWYKDDKNTKCYKLLDGNIGYITLATIKAEDIPNIKRMFAETKGIIIDSRNYPSTFVPFLLGSYFVSANTPFVKFTQGNINNPGEFSFTPALIIPKPGKTYKGKLVVLVNESTQSQAEYTVMAFRAGDNTTVVGSTTAGADGNVSEISLPGGLRTMISGLGVYYPDGTETQRIGIVPDITVNPTIAGIMAGKDELLEKAIEVILQ